MKNEICVPLESLGEADETGEMVMPEVGDEVTATVTGKVTRIEGDKAYLSTGESEESEESGEMSEDDMESAMRDMDEQANY